MVQNPSELLNTKLYIPRGGPSLVQRPRLDEKAPNLELIKDENLHQRESPHSTRQFPPQFL